MKSHTAKNWGMFLAGFLGWFITNTLLFAIMKGPDPADRNLEQHYVLIWIFILLANGIVLIWFAIFKKTRWIALGISCALALNFILSIIVYSFAEARWFIPVTYYVKEKAPTSVIEPQLSGFHEGNEGRTYPAKCQASGWVTMWGDTKVELNVRVLSDGEEIVQTIADLYREDLQSSEVCPDGTCGFLIDLWDQIAPNSAHWILVEAQDPQTGQWVALDNSPKQLACLKTEVNIQEIEKPAPPTYTPDIDIGSPSSTQVVSALNRVKFQSNNRYLIVEFLDDDLVHFELSSFGSGAPVDKLIYTSPMIDKVDYPGPSILIDDGNGNLETPEIGLQVDLESLCITATDKKKEPDLILTSICPFQLDQSWKGITLTPESFTHAYGLGQQFITPGSSDGDWVGRVRSPGGELGNAMVAWNGGAVGNTQFPIVYFAGNANDSYALFMDNFYKQNWDFSSTPWKVEMGGNWLRFYMFTGPDLQDLRKDYMELVGHPLVPPKKMLGLWISEYGFDNWQEIQDKLSTLRRNHFPIDGFVLDLQWFGGIGTGANDSWMGSLTWDLSKFPFPDTKIADLKAKEGIGIVLIEESYISKNLDEHADLESRGYLARECQACGAVYLESNPWWGIGGMIDWTNIAGAEYWHDTKREPLIEDGVIGHWTDLGEPEAYDPEAWYWGITNDYLPLHEHWDIHNLYNFLWSQSIYEGYLRNGRVTRPFILSRSGAPGSQRFGASMWSGDIGSNLSSLATHMNAQMHMSMSGIDYYGADIGGFVRGSLDGNLNDLYTRWFANGMAFDIPGRTHTENLCNCKETAPDRVGDLESNRANLRQRYELSPYLYSLSHRAYLYGEPLMPPLVYYYQSDPEVREIGNEKMIGRDLLAAVVASYDEDERQVYLPAGKWINYHTNEWIESSGKWFGPFPVYIEGIFRLPLFARAGAILPKMYVDDLTMNILGKRAEGSVRNELIIRVYADNTASNFILFEDDNETNAYQNGEVCTTLLSQEQTETGVTVTINKAEGSYHGAIDERDNIIELIMEDAESITRVLLNGKTLPKYDTQYELNAVKSGWCFVGNHLILAKSGDMQVHEDKVFNFLKDSP